MHQLLPHHIVNGQMTIAARRRRRLVLLFLTALLAIAVVLLSQGARVQHLRMTPSSGSLLSVGASRLPLVDRAEPCVRSRALRGRNGPYLTTGPVNGGQVISPGVPQPPAYRPPEQYRRQVALLLRIALTAVSMPRLTPLFFFFFFF